MLLIASSAAMWAVPAWVLHALQLVDIPVAAHLVAVTALYLVNRAMVRGPRRPSANWLRRYSAVAFASLICSIFLLASASVFGVAQLIAAGTDTGIGGFLSSVSRWWGLSGLAVLSATLAFGYTGGQRQLHVSRVEVPLPGWRRGLRILQLSDIHVGQNLSVVQLEQFVDRANREAPDLVCLTGDIADGPQADIDRYFPILGRLRARFGVIAILGNHDHYAGADRVEAALKSAGIEVLRDRAVTLEMDGEKLHVIGLDDRGLDWARGMHDDAVLATLLAAAPDRVAQLLLVHRPDVFRQAAREGVALTLAGHTHGGQLAMPWFGGRRRNFAEFVTRFDRGLFFVGQSRLYVNCGIGVTGQRIRLFTPREISVFDLCGPEPAESLAESPDQLILLGHRRTA
jgi:hypothetical protein